MTERLKSGSDFGRVFDRGGSVTNRLLVCRAIDNGLASSRVGYAVSRKFGGAVGRNRLRRRLKEVVRLNDAAVPPGWDIVILPRGRATEADFLSLVKAFLDLMHRLAAGPVSDGGRQAGGAGSDGTAGRHSG